jgi:hypothetical protein
MLVFLEPPITSSIIAGVNRGLDVSDTDPSRPLNPLCGRSFGAGSPFKQCSSSASVPLSLFVDSRCLSGDRLCPSCSSSSVFCVERNGDRVGGALGPNLSEAWDSSNFCLWYGWGDLDRRLRASSRRD